MTKYKKKGTK